MCFEMWKAGDSRAAYSAAKPASNHAVYQTRSDAANIALQKTNPMPTDIYCLAKQIRRDNQDVMGQKPAKNYAGELSLDEETKKEARKNTMSVSLTSSFLGIQNTRQRKAQLKAKASRYF